MTHNNSESEGNTGSAESSLCCSFCGKKHRAVRKLIAGPAVNICNECIEVCVDVIADDARFVGPDGSGVGNQVVDDQPVATTPELGLVFRCALCRTPTTSVEAVLVPERGPLCPGCVGEIQAAIAIKRGDEGS